MILAKKSARSGFTFVELLIVLAILGLLAAVGIPQYKGYQAQKKLNATKALNSEMVKLIGGEIVKCTSGAKDILITTPQKISCSDTIENIANAFVVYGNSNHKNPYDSKIPPYSSVDTDIGVTSIIARGTTITVTSTWVGGTQTATLTKE